MNQTFVTRIAAELQEIDKAGLTKKERIITSEQGAEIIVNGTTVLNFCANNYLGLSSHPKVIIGTKVQNCGSVHNDLCPLFAGDDAFFFG